MGSAETLKMMDSGKRQVLKTLIAFSKVRKARDAAQTHLLQKTDIRRRYVLDQEEKISVQMW